MDCEKLMALTERFLNKNEQNVVEAFLAVGKLSKARSYVLDALEKKLEGGVLSDEELVTAYAEIGLDPEAVADIRNRSPQH